MTPAAPPPRGPGRERARPAARPRAGPSRALSAGARPISYRVKQTYFLSTVSITKHIECVNLIIFRGYFEDALHAGPRGAEGRRGAGGGAGGGTGPAPQARAGQRAGVERGGILLASRNAAAVSPSPPFSAGRRGASRSPPHEAPAAGSRSGAGQMPESGDESQGIAVKGLLCPLRYPGSDLGRLRMIWRPHAKLERCRVGPRRAQSARARGPCPVAH